MKKGRNHSNLKQTVSILNLFMQIAILKNTVFEYAWGSKTFMSEFLGQPNQCGVPQAEMWMGVHPAGSSKINLNGNMVPLKKVIPGLPFLFKVLAIAKPLSVQVHPDRKTAVAGFARENNLKIPVDNPTRNYRDQNHKPEMICALTPVTVMAGFRPISEILQLIRTAGLTNVAQVLENTSDLKIFVHYLLTMDPVRQTADHYSEAAFQWVKLLKQVFPGDIGIIFPLLLNLVQLAPGEALFLPAGTIHSYLDGVGLELMTNSDNVIRCGLTAKHKDINELLEIALFKPLEPIKIHPVAINCFEKLYSSPVDEFNLSKIQLNAGEYLGTPQGPEILLCVKGKATLINHDNEINLKKGTSLFIPPLQNYRIKGNTTLFKAMTC